VSVAKALEPPPVVVGEGQLGAGVGSFAAHDHPHPGRPASGGEVTEHAGQLGDVRGVAEAAVGVDRLHPRGLGQRQDRRLHGGGHGEPDGEPQVHPAVAVRPQVRQPGPGGAGAVGADEDRGAVPVFVRDLREREVGDRDVVGGGVGPGVTRAQDRGQGLAGVVGVSRQPCKRRVIQDRLL
jgi:hypothetical protein